MELISFTPACIPMAMALAAADYEAERASVPVLPAVASLPALETFAENGLGFAAIEHGRMLGFLCCYSPWEHAFGTPVRGTFVPVHAHGAVSENRQRIYMRLYQVAAEKWVQAGILSHAIALYAHDTDAREAFFTYGFGLRCVDAIRPMEVLSVPKTVGVSYRELTRSDWYRLEEMKRMLSVHLSQSPCFLYESEADLSQALLDAATRDVRVFCAEVDGVCIAFVELRRGGENFAAETAETYNICGAFCLPAYRGRGIYQNLLNEAIRTMRGEGFLRLGVDYESFNPTATAFWGRCFTAYTSSVVRRIDEAILQRK